MLCSKEQIISLPRPPRGRNICLTPLEFIAKLWQNLKLDDPFDAAVFACLVICFYVAARVGNLCGDHNTEGLEVMILHLPHTKAALLEGVDRGDETRSDQLD